MPEVSQRVLVPEPTVPRLKRLKASPPSHRLPPRTIPRTHNGVSEPLSRATICMISNAAPQFQLPYLRGDNPAWCHLILAYAVGRGRGGLAFWKRADFASPLSRCLSPSTTKESFAVAGNGLSLSVSVIHQWRRATSVTTRRTIFCEISDSYRIFRTVA